MSNEPIDLRLQTAVHAFAAARQALDRAIRRFPADIGAQRAVLLRQHWLSLERTEDGLIPESADHSAPPVERDGEGG